MKEFDWEKFVNSKDFVHCGNKYKVNDFLKQAHERGLTWNGVESLLEKKYSSEYGEDTCYRAWGNCNKFLSYNHISYCQRNKYKIIEWSDYMEFTKEDLKVGMLVETNNGFGIIMPTANFNVVAYEKGRWEAINFNDIRKVWGYSSDFGDLLINNPKSRSLLYWRKTVKEMTVEEISEALGYEVKIVKS